jgi:glycosyltransferase involved in cell wall biosynthesis
MPRTLLIHGPAARLSSFSLVNRRLASGLRQHGWRVALCASDTTAARPPAMSPPDVYVFFGHPYDLATAPGRCNVFFLSYDYPVFERADRDLASRLDARFDLILVPSVFVEQACRRSGVTRPIAICPLGVDTKQFRPPARMGRPGVIDAAHPFEFLTLGGAYERKGTDVLLDAFGRVFDAADPVRLTVKAFSYDHCLPWVERAIVRAGLRRPGAAPLRFEHGTHRSVAAYYRSADAGVFPFRGEGFGLPLLECLASGTPIIASQGGGPLDYATAGVTWIPASPVRTSARESLAPDVNALAALMRGAYERGRPPLDERRRIADSVSGWTWERTIASVDAALTAALEHSNQSRHREERARRPFGERRNGAASTARMVPSPKQAHVAFAYAEKGATSWRLIARKVSGVLERRAGRFSEAGLFDVPTDDTADIVVGQSSVCLEAFRRSAIRRPDALRVLYRESAPYADVLAISDRERRRSGVPPQEAPPMVLWRHQQETALADAVVVLSEVSRQMFLARGTRQVHVVRPGIACAARRPRRQSRTTRVLFAASDPFRKGVRILFEAWRRARLPHAELICVASQKMLLSPSLVAELVASPSITFLPFAPHRQFMALYETVDCVVLPTFEDGSPIVIADAIGRGIPAILSDRSGIHEILTHGESAWITPAGSVAALTEALVEAVTDARRRRAVGDAAYEVSRAWTWERFGDELSAVVFR